MAYPSNHTDQTESTSYVTEQEVLDLFANTNKDLKNLRLHYFEVTEISSKDTEIDDLEIEESAALLETPQERKKIRRIINEEESYLGKVDAVGLYLKEMSLVPLLSMEQEITLAKQIEAGNKAKKRLTKLNSSATSEEFNEFSQLIDKGDLAREHLIKANTRLVVSIAKRYIGRGVPFLDLIQEGNLGLMKAVSKYDYQRGFRFSTYATWWIRQTITRAIADQGRTIRVPVHMIDRIRNLYKVARRMEQDLGRPPQVEELAEALDIEQRKVEWMLKVSWLPLSLESPVGDDEESELGMFVEDISTPSPSQSTYEKLLCDKIQEILATLPPREARILRLRFGLENGQTYTLEEVGEKFGLTRERIRQIEGNALKRLRHPLRARQLKEYL
ncbi:MAG: sigma-70 family RNA polymerase sigma factor [Anaerolineales bacterium]|nr:sigma-70 family RNA polymerase sigma factor [Anaerolineales bacterium]